MNIVISALQIISSSGGNIIAVTNPALLMSAATTTTTPTPPMKIEPVSPTRDDDWWCADACGWPVKIFDFLHCCYYSLYSIVILLFIIVFCWSYLEFIFSQLFNHNNLKPYLFRSIKISLKYDHVPIYECCNNNIILCVSFIL